MTTLTEKELEKAIVVIEEKTLIEGIAVDGRGEE